MSNGTFGVRKSADKKGSRNFVGIKNPAIDKLIDAVIFSKDRAGLTTACKALDRALIWNHYVVPHVVYSLRTHRALGPFWKAGQTAGLCYRLSDNLVVG